MQWFLTELIECSVAMSVLILLFIAITPLLEKKYKAKWRYYAWLVIVVGLIIPFRPDFNTALIDMNVPAPQSNFQLIVPGNAETGATGIDTDQQGGPTIQWYQLAGCLWIAGAATVIAYHVLRHHRFTKMLNRWGEEITNQHMLDTLKMLKDEMGIAVHIKLMACPCIKSPMLIGFFRPVIVLPSAKLNPAGMALILRHELVHLKRNDLWYKALVLLATAIHWFNPVVYIMARAIAVQCEISCDEQVLQGASLQQRKQYCETILQVLRNGSNQQTSLSTNFYGGKKGMKARLFSAMDTTKKRAGMTILCVAVIATIGAGMVFAYSSTKEALHGQASTSDANTGKPGTAHNSMDRYSEFLTKVEYDPVQYYYNGHWVRSLYDQDNQSGKSILFLNAVEDQDVLGKSAIHLKTMRNEETNKIEKLVEMSESEVFQLLGNDDENVIIMTMTKPDAVFTDEPQETVTSKENVTNDSQAENRIGPIVSKQVINVDLTSLDSGEFVCLGQYTIQNEDIIIYNITAEGNGNLNVEFRKSADPNDKKGFLGHTGYAGNSVITIHSPIKVENSLSGTYYLWVGNYHGESLKNIKGTVEVAAEKTT